MFKTSTLLLSRNFTRGRSQAETSLSLMQTDQFTSFQQQYNFFCFTCLQLSLTAYLVFPHVSAWSMETSRCCWLLRDVTGEALL